MLPRSVAELDAQGVVLSLDGIGAYDHVSRAAIFDALLRRPELAPLVPFVRLWYGAQSTYLWYDHEGVQHDIVQGEGVEQGDALAPALFALGIDRALKEAAARLRPDEFLLAYLDDVHGKTSRGRARAAFDLVTGFIREFAGVV